jgi:adenosine 3'-phospho 5'-phosphosulfate transporter B3
LFLPRIPFRVYLFLAFLTVSTMGLSNTSLGYLNYPTQVIFKSCKLIPVMIGGVLIQGKTYGLLDLVSVLSMSVGLVFFVLADSQVQPNFDLFGVLLISLALCADAVIGNVQEKAARENSATTKEVIFFSYSIGFVYILVGLLVTGGLWPAFKFCLGVS